MPASTTFQRRGIVEGFFGPPWSMSHRAAMFEFAAKRGMNTYLYAPKDDPYHRERWRERYPESEWKELLKLIRLARERRIDFVYGFHPGKGLHFAAAEPVDILLTKAQRFYDAGVRTFAILFDDIPSRLQHAEDQKTYGGSLAKAEGLWLERVIERQPGVWKNVEWWICPSYYTPDPLLTRMFGAFEPRFLETLADHLPQEVACFWTGPRVVCKKITLAHARGAAERIKRRLMLWDNYPVNDLSMSGEMHLGPLTGRDPRLPESVYGYLNNPLLQEELSFIPLATCFDYAANPSAYDPEESWNSVIEERFGRGALDHWKAIRAYCERGTRQKHKNRPLTLPSKHRSALEAAHRYILKQRERGWVAEFRPWLELMERSLSAQRKA